VSPEAGGPERQTLAENPLDVKRLIGLKELVTDGIAEITGLVERTHRSTTEKQLRRLDVVEPLGRAARAVDRVHRVIADVVYGSIRKVTRAVDAGSHVVLDAAARGQGDDTPFIHPVPPLHSDNASTLPRILDAAQSVLSGFIGDYLHRRSSGLDFGMSLLHEGRPLRLDRESLGRALADASNKVVVFVHGLSLTEWSWSYRAEQLWDDPDVCFGTKLQTDLGYTPLFIRYNTGRHISENGEQLASLAADLVDRFPRNLKELVFVGHSMGGLVARSAAHYGRACGWTKRLGHVFCIGAPHLGAPLEKGANLLGGLLAAFDTPGTQVPGEILSARSSGIKDLRFGYIVEQEWQDKDPDALLENNRQNIPFLDHVGYTFIASTITRDPAHPMGQLIGDLLVRLPSATAAGKPTTQLSPFCVRTVLGGLNHLDLPNHPDVYEQIRRRLLAPLP
jgi:pimeloyl-ACP methyl ester carboxylesterase